MACNNASNCSNVTTLPGDNQCVEFTCDNICSHASVSVTGPVGGSCAPAVAVPTPLPLTWTADHDVCQVVGTGVACMGGVCLPPSERSFSITPCVAAPGDLECPVEFPQRRVFYGGALDGRSCKPCQCGAPNGGGCSSVVDLFSCAGCVGSVLSVTAGQCAEAGTAYTCGTGGPSLTSGKYLGPVMRGTCTPSGGAESVTPPAPDGALTVCCVQ